MNFTIIKGQPYLVNEGRAYPIKLVENGFAITDKKGIKSTEKGRYSWQEIVAKCSVSPEEVSSEVKPQRKSNRKKVVSE